MVNSRLLRKVVPIAKSYVGISIRKPPALKKTLKNTLTRRLKTVRNRLSTKRTLNVNRKYPEMSASYSYFTLPRLSNGRENKAGISYISYNIPNKNAHGYLVAQTKNAVNQEWLDKQAEYIRGLSVYDRKTLAAYTYRSHGWIGRFLRSNGTFLPNVESYYNRTKPNQPKPLVPQIQKLTNNPTANIWKVKNNQELHRDALKLYERDLHRIIRGAPPLPATMVIYRGVAVDPFQGAIGSVHRLKGFASAAYLIKTAANYANRGFGSHNIQRIKLMKGTRVIAASLVNKWDDEGENEVIINSDARYIIRNRNITRRLLYSGKSIEAKVTDITVV